MTPFFKLQITTPQGQEYAGEVVHARIPVEDGSVGVLANHAAYITVSAPGLCLLRERDGQEHSVKVGRGFFTVAKNEAMLLTQSFEKAG